jgi:hypothetical protein
MTVTLALFIIFDFILILVQDIFKLDNNFFYIERKIIFSYGVIK